ncbi:putative Zn(2)-C6 fungal-type domain-containing protein [Seiridium unicorne]|uniref:Zn(2)-C6 fungal-type domain-containing protein n=1 Tax=Seiridium unicorne TaxID=138068 RepID=A0ABR2UFF4_9PEZI
MEVVMPMISDDGALSWSDGHSSSSDENNSILLPPSPIWVNPTTITTATRLETGQLSPVSTELEMPAAGSSLSQMLHSATSSSHDSWTSYSEGDDAEHDHDHDHGHDMHWDHCADDILVPKLEPLEEDDFHMDDLKEAPRPTTPKPTSGSSAQGLKTKRPRGRPRKHPLTPHIATNKVAKGRSKTGCITCRKRKKKCDEAKPRCMNCEKNAVVCEGYNEKTIWKSGKERADEARRPSQELPVITLQPIFQGVETPEDMVFLNHYINQLSGVLTVEGQHKNAFKDMLLQMAVEHRGLMHSILGLASKHIDYETPYGAKILESNPRITAETLQARSEFHHQSAMAKFYEDINQETNTDTAKQTVNLSVRYGQMLCMLLKSMVEGKADGEHRLHLQAYKGLIQASPPTDSAFLVFITEFFQFHVYADELIRLPDVRSPRLALEEWVPWLPIQPVRLIGVADGLFKYLSQITTIRSTIRTNMLNQIDPVVDYASLFRAAEIDAAIREWTPHWPPGDSRERVGLLYKQMMWVYLFRTIYPPSTTTPPAMPTDQYNRPTSPPLSPTSPVHSAHDPHSTDRLRASHAPNSRAESPAPIRYPPHHDARITVAVDESLAILDSIKPSDPCQTLLLIPCLIIGCASFAPSQQNRIRNTLKGVRGYTGLRNCDRLAELLEEMWKLMERGDWALVWDWQAVAKRMGLDFCVA